MASAALAGPGTDALYAGDARDVYIQLPEGVTDAAGAGTDAESPRDAAHLLSAAAAGRSPLAVNELLMPGQA